MTLDVPDRSQAQRRHIYHIVKISVCLLLLLLLLLWVAGRDAGGYRNLSFSAVLT